MWVLKIKAFNKDICRSEYRLVTTERNRTRHSPPSTAHHQKIVNCWHFYSFLKKAPFTGPIFIRSNAELVQRKGSSYRELVKTKLDKTGNSLPSDACGSDIRREIGWPKHLKRIARKWDTHKCLWNSLTYSCRYKNLTCQHIRLCACQSLREDLYLSFLAKPQDSAQAEMRLQERTLNFRNDRSIITHTRSP